MRFSVATLLSALAITGASAAVLDRRQDGSSSSSSSRRSSSTGSSSSSSSSGSASLPLITPAMVGTNPTNDPNLPPYGADKTLPVSDEAGPNGLNNADCQNMTVSVPVNAENINFVGLDDTYSNQSYITGNILRNANFMMAYAAEHQNGTTPNTRSYEIHATYCTPRQGARDNSSLLVAVHGIGFTSAYWDFPYKPEYSLVNQATSHGYSILIYDRLGTGGSQVTSSGLQEPQAATEISIATSVLTKLRDGSFIQGKSFDSIVGIGHSYGSVQMQAITSVAPDLLDGVVLTGYSNDTQGITQFYLGANYAPAADVFPERFADKPRTWLVTGTDQADQSLFFWAPNFNREIREISRAGVDAVTLAGLFTIGSVSTTNPTNFTGPVFVQTGEHDLPFCENDCNTGGKIEGVGALYPSSSNFTFSIVPSTGHGLVSHFSGPQSQRDIVEFVMSNGL